jgi:DNA-binding transcriptional LysR family regulator
VDSLISLNVFRAVAASKSFSYAAEHLGISAAMATKHIKNLEYKVGARLLNRTSRKVSLTEAGDIYLQRVEALLEGLDEAEAVVNQSTKSPKGTLNISAPVWIATKNFVEILARYNQNNPDVKLKLDLSANFVNLVESGFDLALRVGETIDESLIARKICEVQFFAVASPKFLDSYGRPQKIEDLNGVPFLAYSQRVNGELVRFKDETTEWQFTVKPVLKTGNNHLIMLAATSAMGLAILPNWLIADHIESGQLELVMKEQVHLKMPLYALYPNRSYLPAKTRSFIDFMLEPETLAHM